MKGRSYVGGAGLQGVDDESARTFWAWTKRVRECLHRLIFYLAASPLAGCSHSLFATARRMLRKCPCGCLIKTGSIHCSTVIAGNSST